MPDHERTIGGNQYVKDRGRLFHVGPKLASRTIGGETVFESSRGATTIGVLFGGWPVLAELTSDPVGGMARLCAELSSLVGFAPRDADPIADEIERLEAAGFGAMAATLREKHQVKPPAPIGPLDLGACFYSSGQPGVFEPVGIPSPPDSGLSSPIARVLPFGGLSDVRAYLARHANGDHGSVGRLADVTLDDDMRWAPEAFPRVVQNSVAIERGHGLVHSIFSVTPRPESRAKERLMITTLVGCKTVVWNGRSSARLD